MDLNTNFYWQLQPIEVNLECNEELPHELAAPQADDSIVGKKCGKCQVIKEYIEFASNKSRKDGYAGHCKKCAMKAKQACEDRQKTTNKTAWTAKHTKYKQTVRANKKAKMEHGITAAFEQLSNTLPPCESFYC